MKNNCYIDIGGTYTKFYYNNKYFKFETKKLKPLEVVKDFLKDKKEVKNLYIAIAGFYNEKEIIFRKTKHNLSYLKKKYNLYIFNDLEALSYSKSKLTNLYLSKNKFKKNRKIYISIGTGLGVSLIIDNKHIYTELGYLSITDNKLQKIYNKKNLKYQDILSGKGLKKIYEYFNNKKENDFSIIDRDKKTLNLFYDVLKKYISELIYLLPDEIILSGGVILKTINYKKNIFSNYEKNSNFLKMYPDIKLNKNYYVVLDGLREFSNLN